MRGVRYRQCRDPGGVRGRASRSPAPAFGGLGARDPVAAPYAPAARGVRSAGASAAPGRPAPHGRAPPQSPPHRAAWSQVAQVLPHARVLVTRDQLGDARLPDLRGDQGSLPTRRLRATPHHRVPVSLHESAGARSREAVSPRVPHRPPPGGASYGGRACDRDPPPRHGGAVKPPAVSVLMGVWNGAPWVRAEVESV